MPKKQQERTTATTEVDEEEDLINVNNIVPSHNDITTPQQPDLLEPEDPHHLHEDILDFLDKSLECAICLRLVVEPITIPCGHTFCRCCLVKSLQQQRKCPTCRAVCHIVAESAEESMMIKKLTIKRSPHSYQQRVKESTDERASWLTLLPAFIFPDVLFPGCRLDLHLFEPRYRLMMKRVCDSSTLPKFAYVPIDTSTNQDNDDISMALVAHVKDVSFLREGRALVKGIIAAERYIVTESFVENGTGGLHYCRIKPYNDDPMSNAHLDIAVQILTDKDTVDKLDRYLFNSIALTKLSVRCGSRPMYLSPASGEIVRDGTILEQFSLWLSAACPLEQSEKMTFLRSKNTLARLQKCLQSLEESKMKNLILNSDGRWEYSWSLYTTNVLRQWRSSFLTSGSASPRQPNQTRPQVRWWYNLSWGHKNRYGAYFLFVLYSYFHFWYYFKIRNSWMSPSDIATVQAVHYFMCIFYILCWAGLYVWDPLRKIPLHFTGFAVIILLAAFGLILFNLNSPICSLKMEFHDLISYSAWFTFLSHHVPGWFCSKAWYHYVINDIFRFFCRPFISGFSQGEKEVIHYFYEIIENTLESGLKLFHAHVDIIQYPYGALILTFIVLGLLRFGS